MATPNSTYNQLLSVSVANYSEQELEDNIQPPEDVVKLGELLEQPQSFKRHNVAGNGKRDGRKALKIGQSAGNLLRNVEQLQRLGEVVQNG